MSLINDALKRAKESQKPASGGGSSTPLMPVVEASPRGGVNWTIFFIAIVLLAGAFLFIGMALAKHKEAPLLAANPAVIPASTPVAQPQVVTKVITVTQQVEKIVFKPAPASPAPSASAASASPAGAPPASAVPANGALPPSAEPEVPIRVQAIFYSAQNPTAVVNGRSVALNAVLEKEKVRVKAILPSSIIVERGDGTMKKIFLGE